jgi:ornithine carbamoyltransferase
MSIFGRDLICTEDWDLNDIRKILALAVEMKKDPFNPRWRTALKDKSFLMLFYNPSLRTHMSFETAITELGGSAICRTPEMNWAKSKNGISSSEALKDMARVTSRYVAGVGIRILMNAISQYGEGHKFIREFAHFADVPVIGMADDRVHPCQGLADIMGWAERKSVAGNVDGLRGKTLLLTWGSSGLTRPWAAVQSHLLLASRLGMNIKLAYPEGYALDAEVCKQTKAYCEKNNATYEELHDPSSGYKGADVVYVRNWVTENAYQNGEFQYQSEAKRALALKEWIVTEQKMKQTDNAIFANPMPIDRDKEAEEAVIESAYSAIYDVAENRKHVQKALLSLMLSEMK